ncbi:unnamed protein product, partial [Prorocentrum cordatum]
MPACDRGAATSDRGHGKAGLTVTRSASIANNFMQSDGALGLDHNSLMDQDGPTLLDGNGAQILPLGTNAHAVPTVVIDGHADSFAEGDLSIAVADTVEILAELDDFNSTSTPSAPPRCGSAAG